MDDPKIGAWMLDAEKNKERSLVDLLHDYSKQKSAFFYDMKSATSASFDFSCIKAHHSLLLSRVLKEKFANSKLEVKVYQKVSKTLHHLILLLLPAFSPSLPPFLSVILSHF